MPTTEPAAKLKPRRPLWPFIIVGLLVAHVAGMAVAVAITQRDRSFLVVPDYYNKSQHWDAERRAREKLGWTVRIDASPIVDPDGFRAVSFFLVDARGDAVANLPLQVTFFHHAHPDRQQTLTLLADAGDGRRFTRALPMRDAGVWEFHFLAGSGDATFTSTQTQYVMGSAR